MLTVLEVLKECNIDAQTILKEKQTIILQKRPNIAQVKETKTRYVNGTVNRSATVEKFKSAEHKIQENKIPSTRLFIDSSVGHPFGEFGQIDHVLDEGKSELKHNAGEVLLVSIWAAWSKGCLKPMQRISKMMDENEDAWGDKVRTVAVNADEKKEDAANMIEEHHWSKMEHLTINGWDKKDKLLQNFAIEGVPFVVLVDKFGKVDYEGDPNHTYLEARISELLLQQQEEEYVKPPVNVINYISEYEKSEDRLRELLTVDNVGEIFKDSGLFCSKLTVQSIMVKGVIYKQFLLELYIYDGDLIATRKIKQLFQSIPKIQVKLNQVRYIQVPEVADPACWQCNIALQYPYYWLKWEQGQQFGCISCVHRPSDLPDHHLSYEQNSVLLTGKWKRIPIKGFGSNLQPQDVTKHTKIHEFACNACDGCSPLGQARYICLGCRSQPNFNYDYIDLCQACIPTVGEATEAMSKCFERQMHCANHPWLRILYQAGSYQRY